MYKVAKTQRIFLLMLAVLTVLLLLSPLSVHADTGPKPSVRIRFENMGEELCYGTLLSETRSTGPQSVWDGSPETAYYKGNPNFSDAVFDYDTWRAFVRYNDSDGYFFLQTEWEVSQTKEIAWTYYPPQRFKILLYFPEEGKFVSGGICERYAFDSYYTVDMDGLNISSVTSGEEVLSPYRSYDYVNEVLSFLARVVVTVLVELGIAFLFGFRERKQILFLTAVNCVTQVLLNALLNLVNYFSGQLAFLLLYVALEIVVFVLEAAVYCLWMKKFSAQPKKNFVCVVYALVANAVSFGAGLGLAVLIPGIF